jgi:uncharacterized protein (TIGR03437 family)
VFGKHLATGTASAFSGTLQTTLGGTAVAVQDSAGVSRPAQLSYVSPGQVNFLVPTGTATGPATITVSSGDGQSQSASVLVAPVSPALFTAGTFGIAAANVVTVGPDNTQTVQPAFTVQNGMIVTDPIDVSSGNVYLTLFGTGFDKVSAEAVSAVVDNVYPPVSVSYAGTQPAFAGLDQVNILLPKTLAGYMGFVPITLTIGGVQANTVYIEVK